MQPENEIGGPTTILVIDGDGPLGYLLERYARRSGLRFRRLRAPWRVPPLTAGGPLALWLGSLEWLEAVSPRETGLVGDDAPVIVSASREEESRAHSLGADFCAGHPLKYPDFLAALRAVGIAVGDENGHPVPHPGSGLRGSSARSTGLAALQQD
jgi:hypothetical protein